MLFTPNLGLGKPPQGAISWDATINGNLDILDSAITAAKNQPLGAVNEVTFSSSARFDLSKGAVHHLVLTGDVPTPQIVNPSSGNPYIFIIEQNSPGGHGFTFPANFLFADNLSATTTPNMTASGIVVVQPFVYLASSARFVKFSPTLYG